jgi:poly-gamma-glutamate biosynthesis protein PgsC/CapC
MEFECLFIGLVVAVLWIELTGFFPGGIIVPGYFALYLESPLRILATIGVAFLALFSFKLLARFFILFGRRRFVLVVLLGGLYAQLWFVLFPQLFPPSWELRIIGWIIPGLLANNLERQKMLPTFASLGVTSVITYFLARLVSGL